MSDSGVSLRLEFRGLAAFQTTLDQLALASANRRPVLEAIGGRLLLSTQERFERQCDSEGKPWKPLALSTLMHRAGKNPWTQGGLRKGAVRKLSAAQILHRSGRLLGSISTRVHDGAVEVGTNTVYARIHQLGGDAGRGHKTHIPARPYLGINAADEAAIVAIVNRHIGRALM